MSVEFLGVNWTGEGVVRGWFGRTVRRFVVTYEGAWSEDHESFHLDECITYSDGRSLERAWAIGYVGLGRWSGVDGLGDRMVIRDHDDWVDLRFARSAALKGVTVASLRLKLRPGSFQMLLGRGVTRVLGVPVAWTQIALRRR